MELRPRKGRSVQPSTPTIAKPSPRPPPQSSSRKKVSLVPSTPIYIPSDDEYQDPNVSRVDPADGVPQEIYADEVAAASTEYGDEGTLKQDNQDIILPDSVEFETPLSSITRLRHAQIKVSSSNVNPKSKVSSSNNKKMAKTMNFTPVADTCIAHDRITVTLEKVGLDEALAKKVFGAASEDATSEEIEKQEALTGSVPQKSDGIAVEITLLAQDMCIKKTEVLSPSIDSKQVYSSTKKSVKKRHEEFEVVDAKLDQGGRPEHIVDVDAPIVSEPQALSLILSDDEAVQVSDAVRVDRCEEKISASKEAAQENFLPSVEVSKARRESKKSQCHKEDIMEEESLSRKLFEETSDVTIPCTETKHDDQSRQELGLRENSSKEGMRKIDSVEVKNFAETVISTSERHNFKSPSTILKGREVADVEMLDIDKDNLDASDIGIKGKDIVIDGVQEVSDESSDEAASSREDRDGDINSDHPKLNAATACCSQKNVVHDKECRSSDDDGDDDGNASSGSDDDDDEEDEMASIFFSSMKANLQKMSELSGLSMQKDEQANQDALVRLESQLTKSAVKKPCANGRSTGYGLSWSPEIDLSALKTLNAQLKKPRSVVEASPNTIWGKDQCLQDGLCVPPVDPRKLNKLARKQKDDTAGAKWFNLSAPTITPEIKKELQLVKLRGALDPKRHYKADDSKGLPKYFQVGTVVGGPADFYSGRLTKREQKSSLASELLSDSSLTAYRKRKYLEIQEQKQAGGKGFWKKKKSKQTPAWAKI